VVDATRLCARVTELLTQARTNWGTALDKYQSKHGVPAAYLDEWIDIDFISQASKPVVRLIYYPFFVLTIMILSRNHYFDSWDWPPALLLILGCSSVYAVYCALRLRGAAERARTQCLTTLHEKLSRVLADKGEPDARLNIMASNETAPATVSHPKGLADQLRMMIEQIEQTEQGAFAPVARHPVLAAVFMPFGGAGILALLEYLATH
jgi:hypothetical protein